MPGDGIAPPATGNLFDTHRATLVNLPDTGMDRHLSSIMAITLMVAEERAYGRATNCRSESS